MSRIAVALALLAALARAASGAEVERSVEVAGVVRTYLLHVPPGAAAGAPLPLVVVLHGAGGNARVVSRETHFSEEADWSGFVAAYPNGSDGATASVWPAGQPLLTWNAGHCCGWASQRRVGDVAFVRAMVEAIAREVPIDRRRIYAAGMSNGGMMSYRLACEASDLFAAVGVVSGALVTESCAPSEPVSVIQIHGAADSVVPLGGGPADFVAPGYAFPPAASAIAFWRAADGCGATPRESRLGPGVRLSRYEHCRAGSAVDFYVLDAGKHSWPGSGRVSVILPPVSETVAATPLLWQFFASHPKPER